MPDSEQHLWQQVTSYDALGAAWARVDHNEGSAGGDGVTRHEFHADRFARLNQLRADLLSGDYAPRPYRKVSIPKKKPGYRILTIPSIRDRIVHTSIAAALTPILEKAFEESSFAYRPNRGVTQAVARIEQWRRRGYTFVIEADIVRYFDNIRHDLLLEKLEDIIGSLPGAQSLMTLIAAMLAHQGTALGTEGRGLVQGSPLSPLLANLYLDALDEDIDGDGVKLVRFADDFVVLCKSDRKAKTALKHCVEILGRHGLELHEDGTRIVNFDKGFDFIGYLFLRTLAVKEKADPRQQAPGKPIKSEVTHEGVIRLDEGGSRFDQGHRVLYVIDPDHLLTVRNKSFSVRQEEGKELIAIGHKRIGRIEVGPAVGFDRQAVLLAMDTATPMTVVDGLGQTRGSIEPKIPKRGGLHLAQARAITTNPFRAEISRRIVESRIRNARTQLARLNRRPRFDVVRDVLIEMKGPLAKVLHEKDVKALMGLEGTAIAAYWTALGALHRGKATEFKRSRPARDPLNAAINYLTGILERDVRAAIHASGLHTGFAFLHGTRDRHEGLLYDMMEPFRSPLSEGLPVFLFSARRLKPDMFTETSAGRIEISSGGRKALIEGYENAVAKRVNRPDGAGKLGWRAMMVLQCRSLVSAVETQNVKLFLPYLMEA